MLEGSHALTGWIVLDPTCWNRDRNEMSHVGLLGPEPMFGADKNLHDSLQEDHSTQGGGRPLRALPADEVREFA